MNAGDVCKFESDLILFISTLGPSSSTKVSGCQRFYGQGGYDISCSNTTFDIFVRNNQKVVVKLIRATRHTHMFEINIASTVALVYTQIIGKCR